MRFNPVLVIALGVFAFNTADAFDAQEQTEMVTVHNKYRSMVEVPALIWSASLASIAQVHADNLKAAQACKPSHSLTAGIGENLFWASAMVSSNGVSKRQAVTATQVTDSWGSEKENYSAASNTCAAGKVCGHYTQIVWQTTTQIGCGNAVCDDHTQIWVCNYSPAGNVVGKKPY